MNGLAMSVLYDDAKRHPAGYREVDAIAVARSGGKVRVIDVREPSEFWGELAHPPGAELVPLGTLEQAAKSWNKEEEVVIVCRSGARSARAALLLSAMGFKRPMNMLGGMMAWHGAGLAVER
jgi:rhodanese-related sulfurtransferase